MCLNCFYLIKYLIYSVVSDCNWLVHWLVFWVIWLSRSVYLLNYSNYHWQWNMSNMTAFKRDSEIKQFGETDVRGWEMIMINTQIKWLSNNRCQPILFNSSLKCNNYCFLMLKFKIKSQTQCRQGNKTLLHKTSS